VRYLAECHGWQHGKFGSIWSGLSEDILRYLNKSPENQASGDSFKTRLSAFLTPQLLCLLIYRVSHYLEVTGWRRLAAAGSRLNMLWHKVNIPPDTCIGPGCFLPHPAAVTFYGTAGRGLTLYSLAVCVPECQTAGERGCPPHLGDRVTIAAHAYVAGPVRVGSDTKISFLARITRDIPAGSLVVVPATWGNQISRRFAGRGVA
jgi:serine O-acetyltransferase